MIPVTAIITAIALLTSGFMKQNGPELGKPASALASTSVAGESGTGDSFAVRMQLYDKLSKVTNVEWYWIAAVDQYERSISKARPKARPLLGQTVGVFVEPERWAGALNPYTEDNSPVSIRWFGGIGQDGDGNGSAERTSDFDLLYSLIRFMSSYGINEERFPIGIWEYYHNSRAAQRVTQFASLYRHYGRLDLFEHAFPLPIGNSYSYRDTWGDRRGWGGRRIHEGTDIFAGYGTPVRSTCYGVIEVKGWNKYGGWRIGIRDLNNHYHYYAHLSGFDKTIAIGDIVKPGQVVGRVGSSGYGKPGTSGKFPPHLHYGVYSDRGLIEWAFDPYPMLRRWEQAERKQLRSKG
ncbi:M23 family metallopeptidase [Paenibacillus sp. HB172176]|uniref:M23 family metallopeptidase n=1 Tax=Paenibacillus sp. HB172176 TaxID=2493690 RepID=UPI0014392905|nr:M23 family metallopeptidase [Paenibacillus sp. HB172176]